MPFLDRSFGIKHGPGLFFLPAELPCPSNLQTKKWERNSRGSPVEKARWLTGLIGVYLAARLPKAESFIDFGEGQKTIMIARPVRPKPVRKERQRDRQTVSQTDRKRDRER
jgi:hypothetical protein